MLIKVKWLAKSFLALLRPNGLKFFKESYVKTQFNATFSPSWSQAGEDLAIYQFLSSTALNKFYIDIGAHDPNRFSVTRKLYEDGWVGIDVDGNSDYESEFVKYRPLNTFMNACVGNQSQYHFTIFVEGALSSINSEWIDRFENAGQVIAERRIVQGITLREILDIDGVPHKIDFLNVDVEGADEEALRSIDFESLPLDRYPEWILLETSPPVSTALHFPAVSYAVEHGYTPWLVLPMATLLKSPEKNR